MTRGLLLMSYCLMIPAGLLMLYGMVIPVNLIGFPVLIVGVVGATWLAGEEQ